MRDIKFRQFINEKFHYWGFLEGGFVNPMTSNGSYKDALKASKQYTGLKDKNGVEIYEGDIIKTTVGKHEWHYLVRRYAEFDGNLYGDTVYRNFAHYKDTDEYDWGDYYLNEKSRQSLNGAETRYEVIGNKYENAELLEGDTRL